MKWLWFAGPLVFIFVVVVVSLVPSHEERRLRQALSRWLDEFLGPLLIGSKKRKQPKSRRVRRVPAIFDRILDEIGGGTRVSDVVLIPKLAYLAARVADTTSASNHFTVLCKLAKPAPTFICHPLPLVDGRPATNTGVVFAKDPEFMESHLVEGDDAEAITRWLKTQLREALMDMPEVWLRTDGRVMALTLYGCTDAEAIDELVAGADAIFALRGAGGAESLFGSDDDAPLGEAAYRHAPKPTERRSGRPMWGSEDGTVEQTDPATVSARIAAGAIDLGLYAFAAIMVAAIVGKFHSFHPSVLFNSPDIVNAETWQGGWTTKGFGAFVAAESLLVGLFAYQGYLAAHHGRSIGKRIVGARVVHNDGGKVSFMRGLLLRSWLFGLVPIAAAAALTRPFSVRAFFVNIPQLPTAAVAAAVLAIAVASFALSTNRRGVHDLVSGTRVISAEPLRLLPVQLGVVGRDPVVAKRLTRGVAILVGFIVLNVIAHVMDFGFWIY